LTKGFNCSCRSPRQVVWSGDKENWVKGRKSHLSKGGGLKPKNGNNGQEGKKTKNTKTIGNKFDEGNGE